LARFGCATTQQQSAGGIPENGLFILAPAILRTPAAKVTLPLSRDFGASLAAARRRDPAHPARQEMIRRVLVDWLASQIAAVATKRSGLFQVILARHCVLRQGFERPS
jgi:hypothetical protein